MQDFALSDYLPSPTEWTVSAEATLVKAANVRPDLAGASAVFTLVAPLS